MEMIPIRGYEKLLRFRKHATSLHFIQIPIGIWGDQRVDSRILTSNPFPV